MEGPALAELFESAKLKYMKMRVLHGAMVVKLDSNSSVPFNPCNSINKNGLHSLAPNYQSGSEWPGRYAPREYFA